ncbi:hypothetical protein Bca52824_047035 [Brassica carinata]|uniref:Replication factor A C-terminal domain-containing protein n=1 Tax=Brassica carinata TaxID=52824 RepID=A0A8X7URS8_BRACI|nr:hypothetical protein Bca52824_047035 [Brassica carinata]
MANSKVSEVKNLKRVGELMRLNLLIVDLNVKRVLYRLVARDTGLTPAAPLLREIAKVEPVTEAELNSFVTTAVSEDIEFMCTGTVIRPDSEKGWCYVACSKSSRKLKRTESAFTCVRCENYHAVGVLRYISLIYIQLCFSFYRMELTIADDTDEGIFVCFDRVMTKLHGLEAHAAGQILGGDDNNDQKIHAEVESRGSGEAALIAATEPIGAMLSKMDDPASQVVKKIYNQHNMYLNNAYA